MWILFLSASLVLVSAGGGTAHAEGPAIFMKGFTLGGWSSDDYLRASVGPQLEVLQEAGVEWIALTPRWFQESRGSTDIGPHRELSPSDESLLAVIALARSKGFHVFLKPQVDLVGPGWRGEIAFSSEGQWSEWFSNYLRFLKHYAFLSSKSGVSLLCVGVELDATRHRESDWRSLIRNVRETFPGPLTYAANWGREIDIEWWDELDYAGVDAYFPVAKAENPSATELNSRWAQHLLPLRKWAQRIERPVIFTEIGYRSLAGAGVEPWEWKRSGTPSPMEQAELYRAALKAVWSKPWLAGLFWWQWRTEAPSQPQVDTGFSPQGKPAFDVLREYYGREARCPTKRCS